MLSTGEDVTIEKVELEALTEAETTYNFEVADFHTYYGTERDVLVDNDCGFTKLVEEPKSIWGKTADEISDILGEGWTKGTYGSRQTGWKFIKGDKMVAYHPGGGRHVGSYYKLSSSSIGKIKVVGADYLPSIGEKALIIYI